MHQLRSYSAVNPTTHCTDHTAFRAAYLPNSSDFLADKLFLRRVRRATDDRSKSEVTNHGPVCRALADVQYKSADNFSPSWGMGNFGMELDSVPRF